MLDLYRLELGSQLVSLLPRVLRSTFRDFKIRGLPRPRIWRVESALLGPGEFRLLCRDREVTRQQIYQERRLALGPAEALVQLEGQVGPWEGNPRWIRPEQRRRALQLGCKVWSSARVMEELLAFHMYGVADKSLGFDVFERMLKQADPDLVRTVRREFDLWQVRKLFLRCLNEALVLRPVERILRGLVLARSTDYGAVMRALNKNPLHRHLDSDGQLPLHELPAHLEAKLLAQLEWSNGTARALSLLLPSPSRSPVACHPALQQRLARSYPMVTWISREEIPEGTPVRWLGTLK